MALNGADVSLATVERPPTSEEPLVCRNDAIGFQYMNEECTNCGGDEAEYIWDVGEGDPVGPLCEHCIAKEALKMDETNVHFTITEESPMEEIE